MPFYRWAALPGASGSSFPTSGAPIGGERSAVGVAAPNITDTMWLRTADCLHLVTAMHHGFAEIFTYDANQSAAAFALGLKPLNA